MGRRRFAVVLLVPQPFASEIDVLRRALGVADVARIAPHVTIVPPVNVAEEALDDALDLLHGAAAHAGPIDATLGPVASFWPTSPVLFLDVGDDDAVRAMAELRDRLFLPPLSRPEGRRFVPHVTLFSRMPDARIPAALDTLPGYEVEVRFDRLHLLEEVTGGNGRVWRPAHDVPFGAPAVVGRGGVELEVTVTSGLPLDAQRFIRHVSLETRSSVLVRDTWQPLGDPVVVTARRTDAAGSVGVVGVLAGWQRGALGGIDDIVVAEPDRRQGIARQLLLRAESEAAANDVAELVARVDRDAPACALFTAAGWMVEGGAIVSEGRDLVRLVRVLDGMEPS